VYKRLQARYALPAPATEDPELASTSDVATNADVEMTPAEAVAGPASPTPSAHPGEANVTTDVAATAAASAVASLPAPPEDGSAADPEDDSIAAGTTADVREVEVEPHDDRPACPSAAANEEPAEKKARL